MPVSITCPGCKSGFEVPEDLIGKMVWCATCYQQVFVKRPAPAPKSFIREVIPGTMPDVPQIPTPTEDPYAYGDTDYARLRTSGDAPKKSEGPYRLKRRRRHSDPLVYIAFGVVGVVLVTACVSMALALRNSGSDRKNPDPIRPPDKPPITGTFPVTPPPPLRPANPAPPAAWQWVKGSDGFEAEMPGPASQDSPTSWQYRQDPEIYAVNYHLGQTADQVVAAWRANPQGWGSNVRMRFARESSTTVTGLPGTELTYTSDTGASAGVCRVVQIGDRVYTAAATVPKVDSARLQRFLDSFRVTYIPAPGGVAVMPPRAGPGPGAAIPPFPAPAQDPDPFKAKKDPFLPRVKVGMDDPNPGQVRPPAGGAVPAAGMKPKLITRIDPLWAVAFYPSKNEVWTIGGRLMGAATGGRVAGMLRRYSYPDFKLKGSYHLPNLASKARIDEAKGLLYITALTKPDSLVAQGSGTERMYGDGAIQVFDLGPIIAGQVQERDDLKPLATISNPGKPVTIELTPDGKSLYCLSETFVPATKAFKAKLTQYDTTKRTVVKEITLPEPTRDMCWSADGRQLYLTEWPVGSGGVAMPGKPVGVLVIDPVSFTKSPTIPLPGFTNDVTPSPGGRIVATVAGDERNRLFTIDVAGGASEELTGGGTATNAYARFTPDGKKLIVSSTGYRGGVDVYDVDDAANAAGFRRTANLTPSENDPATGYFRLSPDGTLAIFNTGAVLDVVTPAK